MLIPKVIVGYTVNEIQSKIIKYTNKRNKSINHCLYVLGASWDEVYHISPTGQVNKKTIGKNRSIYDNLERGELLDWAKHLYREAIIKYHPDKHPENERLYTEICQELGKVYNQAKKILLRGKGD